MVSLALPANGYESGTNVHVLRTIAVQPGGVAATILFQPAIDLSGTGLSVRVDGGAERGFVGGAFHGHGAPESSRYGGFRPTIGGGTTAMLGSARILASRGLGPRIEVLESKLNGGSSGDSSVVRAESDVAGWPDQWLAYTPYDMVVVSARDLEAMDADVRAALGQYVQVGGVVTVLGVWEPPHAAAPRSAGSWVVYDAGFGQWLVGADDLKSWTRRDWEIMGRTVNDTAQPLLARRTPAQANTEMPVIEQFTIPVRGLLLIVILFAVLIGPVNLIVLARMKMRIHMLWTVPAVSFLAAGTIVAYATFAEGFSATGRTQGLTILDERTGQATTVGWTAYYSPLTPSNGLRFGADTELTAQIADDEESYRGRSEDNRSLTVDWTNQQHLTGAWMLARVPLHLAVRKCEPRRERLLFHKTAGRVSVVNGLGAPITRLRLMDGAGVAYVASDIAPGAQAVLTADPDTLSRRSTVQTLRAFYMSGRWYATGSMNDPLTPGTYRAVLDGSPFIEAGLDHLKTYRTINVVCGLLRDPSGAASEAPPQTPNESRSVP
jgi:hypothetical protein